jgi:predicted nucleic acid-binding protein
MVSDPVRISMTESPALTDTNILVYAFDADSGRKHAVAKEMIGRSWRGKERYAVSIQNLAEFSVVVREKVAYPVPSEDVRQFLSLVMRSRDWQVLGYGAKTIIRAHEIRDEYHLHFWDALLAATMEENSVRTIITEDAHFRNIPWISVQNPFA